jgi:hypothetical protein
MADFKTKYGAGGQTISITLDGLGDGSLRQSTEIDNASNLFLDALISGRIIAGAAPAASRSIVLYAYGSADGGTTRTGGAGASDAAFGGEEDSLFLLGVIPTGAGAGQEYEFGPFSLSRAFGGVAIPEKWGIVVKNDTGAALASGSPNHYVLYQGIHAQSV